MLKIKGLYNVKLHFIFYHKKFTKHHIEKFGFLNLIYTFVIELLKKNNNYQLTFWFSSDLLRRHADATLIPNRECKSEKLSSELLHL